MPLGLKKISVYTMTCYKHKPCGNITMLLHRRCDVSNLWQPNRVVRETLSCHFIITCHNFVIFIHVWISIVFSATFSACAVTSLSKASMFDFACQLGLLRYTLQHLFFFNKLVLVFIWSINSQVAIPVFLASVFKHFMHLNCVIRHVFALPANYWPSIQHYSGNVGVW